MLVGRPGKLEPCAQPAEIYNNAAAVKYSVKIPLGKKKTDKNLGSQCLVIYKCKLCKYRTNMYTQYKSIMVNNQEVEAM